jgi:hypothetical protein
MSRKYFIINLVFQSLIFSLSVSDLSFSLLISLIRTYKRKHSFRNCCQKRQKDLLPLDSSVRVKHIKMIIFESRLTTFEASGIFEVSGAE